MIKLKCDCGCETFVNDLFDDLKFICTQCNVSDYPVAFLHYDVEVIPEPVLVQVSEECHEFPRQLKLF